MSRSASKAPAFSVFTFRRVVLLIAGVLALYVVVPQITGFHQSLDLVLNAHKTWLLLALGMLTLTYGLNAGVYVLLAPKLAFWSTTLLQVAVGFVGKILPIGLGSIGLNAYYLRKQGHSLPNALAIVGLNNTIFIIAHISLLAAVGAFGFQLPKLQAGVSNNRLLVLCIVVLLLGAAWALGTRFYGRFRRAVLQAWTTLLSYRYHPLRLAGVFILSVGYTLVLVAILMMCARALDQTLPFSVALLVFTAGLVVGTATPTPGGVLGAEAGLVAALTTYNVPIESAIALALLFRFITFWVPLLPGFTAFLYMRRTML